MAALRQVVSVSIVAWLGALVLGLVLVWTLGVGFGPALGRACFIVAIFVFGAGAASIGGGVTGVRPLGPADTAWRPVSRAGVPDLSGPLTLLGSALLVVPQLLLAGGALYR